MKKGEKRADGSFVFNRVPDGYVNRHPYWLISEEDDKAISDNS